MSNDKEYLLRAIELAKLHSRDGTQGPFGAIIVKDGNVIAEGWNQVVKTLDPSAHAEVVAIRNACKLLDDFKLTGCTLYSSCEPCPMCLSASIWARLDRVVYAETREGAALAGFDDAIIYQVFEQGKLPDNLLYEHLPMDQAGEVFRMWRMNDNKRSY